MTTLAEMQELLKAIPQEAWDAFREARAEEEAARKKQGVMRLALIKTCTHPLILERPYFSYYSGSTVPPRRKCQICGIEEDGWGSGYKKLADTWYGGILSHTNECTKEQIERRHVVVVNRDKFDGFQTGDDPIL
jgi:hypothetical protein